MASSSAPRIYTFKAAAVSLPEFRAVKASGTDGKTVAQATAATDKIIGISQVAGVASGDPIEVAQQGGGGKAKLGGTVAFGDYLTSDANGKLVTTTTANDKVCAQAMQAGVLDDVIGVEVVSFNF